MNDHDSGERLAVPPSSREVAAPPAGICFVTRKWAPAIGGMETYSEHLAEELAHLVEVRVLALPGNADGSRPGGLRLLRFGLATALRLVSARRAPGVVHVGDMASWPLALAARLRSGRSRIALSAHGTDVSYPRRGGIGGRIYGAYLRAGALLLRGAVVIANSRATAEAVRSFGFAEVRVVRLGTDVVPRVPAETGESSAEVLFVGRLTPLKGCAWFIREVLPMLPADIALRVAGTVWDADEAAALESPRVRFLGPVRGEALIREYAHALCVVLPDVDVPSGQFEGFGLTATEAAAAGGVVLAARHGGLRDAVVDGETGFHLPSGDEPRVRARNWKERFPPGPLTPRAIGDAEWADRWGSLDQRGRLAWEWRTIYCLLDRAAAEAPAVRLFRFEDLFGPDAGALRELVAFAADHGERRYRVRDLSGFTATVRNASKGPRRTWADWSDADARLLDAMCGPLMRKHGYGAEPEWQAKLGASRLKI